MFEAKKPKRWQNLFYKKCPNCNSELKDARLFWECSNSTGIKSCFFIGKEKAAALLLDPEHPANKCLTLEQKRLLAGVEHKEITEEDIEVAVNNLNLIL